MNKKFEPFLAHSDITNCIYIIDNKGKYEVTEQCIKAMQETNRMPRWIPISEKLPEKSGEYWCAFGGADTNLTGSDYYTTESDAQRIFDDPEEFVGWRSRNVIAWMALPEHYKPESEE